jgi:hypothetical protein
MGENEGQMQKSGRANAKKERQMERARKEDILSRCGVSQLLGKKP